MPVNLSKCRLLATGTDRLSDKPESEGPLICRSTRSKTYKVWQNATWVFPGNNVTFPSISYVHVFFMSKVKISLQIVKFPLNLIYTRLPCFPANAVKSKCVVNGFEVDGFRIEIKIQSFYQLSRQSLWLCEYEFNKSIPTMKMMVQSLAPQEIGGFFSPPQPLPPTHD